MKRATELAPRIHQSNEPYNRRPAIGAGRLLQANCPNRIPGKELLVEPLAMKSLDRYLPGSGAETIRWALNPRINSSTATHATRNPVP